MRAVRWLAAVALVLASTAEAQPRRAGPGAGQAAPAGRREQIKKRIRVMRAVQLTEELALDEATAARLFPALSRYDDEIDKLLEKRVEVQRRLQHADTLRDAKAIDRLIEEAVANQHGFWDLEDRRLAELRKILTPVQTARLLVVLPALERKIQNQLRKAIVQRPGAPAEADDDVEPDEPARPPAKQPLHRREAPLPPRGATSNAPGNTPPCDPNTGPCR